VTGALEPASPLSFGSLAQLTLSLVAIVALILVLGWVLRRLKFATPRVAADMRVIDELSVGPRERIALVRIGDAQVLVGISGHPDSS
jgi:flagellar protein FliO/FliZ